MKKLSLLLLVVGLSLSQAFAQFPCATDEMTKQAIEENPALLENLKALEKFTEEYLKQNPSHKRNTQYIIPVVFHIMHDGSTTTNIKKSRVLAAINQMNLDFQGANSDTSNVISAFKHRIGSMDVEFRLAQLDPQGNCTDGITRTYTPLTDGAGENVKFIKSWDTDKYFNIWVVKSVGSGGGGGVTLGYAFKPGSAPSPQQEGVIVRADVVGSSTWGNQGLRTLTHEVGHYLSLDHTWGGSNSPGSSNNCTIDDGVADTPKCAGTASGCDLTKNSCNDTTFYGFDQVDNMQNHMEYTSCNRMFTIGQADKMEAALNSFIGSRKLLWQPANLTATGTEDGYTADPCAMKPDFRSSKTTACKGSSITFADMSWNGKADSWKWIITGPGTVSISNDTDSNMTANFPVAGSYTVKLEVTNASGTSTIEKESYISIIDDTPKYSRWSMDNFDTYTSLPADYLPQGEDTITFDLNQNIGWYTSPNSLWLNNYKLDPGTVSSVILPTMEVSGTNSPVLTFDYAFAKRTNSSNDQVKLYVSTNCGTTWIPRMTINTADLKTVNQNYPLEEFQPSNIGEWKNASLSLTSYKATNNIAVKIEFISGQGNNFYVDNINLRDAVVGLEENQIANLQLFPNPAKAETKLSFTLASEKELSIEVIDLLGNTVQEVSKQMFDAGNQELSIQLNNDLPAGVYLVRLQGNDLVIQERLVISK